MDEEKMYNLNHRCNNETLYYQQQHTDALPTASESLSHSFVPSSTDSSQSSPLSPHFPQDNRYNSVLAMCAKDFGLLDSYRKTWTQSESSKAMQMINSQSNRNIMWNTTGQGESDDFLYAYSPQSNETRSQDVTRGNYHKLDSFTEVFSTHNLSIQANSMPPGLHSQSSLMDHASDSALRQLLSQKPAADQASVHPSRQRYQQVSQHVHQSFANTQQKQQMDVDNHQQQQPFYYNYPQQVSHVQHQGQYMQANHMPDQQMQQIQQSSYCLQPHPQEQQCHSLQEIQQQAMQTQFPVQISQYYQAQTVMQQIQHVVQVKQQPMQLQPPLFQKELNQNISQELHHCSHDQTNPAQLIPLRAASQYFYQNSQNLNNYCHQSLLHQQKQYHNDFGSQLFLGPQANPTKSALIEKQAKQQCCFLGTEPISPQPVSPTSVTREKQQLSATSMWPQISQPESRLQKVSPKESSVQHKRPSTEICGVKSRMTCSVCSREFKSLPALNGHMRSHGGMRASPIYEQVEEEKQQQPKEAESLSPIIMPVSVPVKLPPNEDNLIKDNSAIIVPDDEMPILTRMTRSPPCYSKAPGPITSSEAVTKYHKSGTTLKTSEENNTQQEKKKYRHRPDPLFIPPPTFSFSMSHSGATLYQSQLRSPCVIGDHLLVKSQELPPYTPPPMLSPVWQGSGLFSSVITTYGSAVYSQLPPTPLTPTPRVLLFRNSLDGGNIPVTPGPGEQTIDIEPRINIGSKFQAQIPALQSQSVLKKEVHNATLVWKPLTVLENQECLQQVKDFSNMSCSSVLPGGGTNLEYALHCLFEVDGDIIRALEMLLLKRKCRSKRHPLANYHYAGADRWTSQERKLFNKAVANTNKDLFRVHKMVNSKTMAQCVEYYYTWKKILRFGRKHRTRLAEVSDDSVTSAEEEDCEVDNDDDYDDHDDVHIHDEEDVYEVAENKKSENEELCEMQNFPENEELCDMQNSPEPPFAAALEPAPAQNTVSLSVSFICEMPKCGAMFSSRQALNGHARIHGGTNQVPKTCSSVSAVKLKTVPQTGCHSIKSSPAHSTTSGETDPTTTFPCKECCKVFFKIKSRNAHMKTHRQQEEQQRQKAQKAAVAAEMAATIARTKVPMEPALISLHHLGLMRHMEHGFEDSVAQDLCDVMDEVEVMAADFLLDNDGADLLQCDTEM